MSYRATLTRQDADEEDGELRLISLSRDENVATSNEIFLALDLRWTHKILRL